ncbi:MAG TPA: hypothetical protein VFA77_17930 [Candidatus Eisenbacteria bacterium]|jgi:hypothetical protein|nr:hypothetical protein [Candidatus Eisenbacteria bacterium]
MNPAKAHRASGCSRNYSRMQVAVLAATLIIGVPIASSPAAETPDSKVSNSKPAYDLIDRYFERDIEGWRVLVHQSLLEQKRQSLCDRTLKLLDDHLFRITRVVPSEALAKLRKIPIWVELAHPRHPCMCYHESADWLREHDMNPAKAGAVEIANAEKFLTWTHDQPWMVLHELAHGYHHQILGFDHAGIQSCFERAVASKSYESVLRISGKKERAYALNNAKEYFAELTEAYFGTNDFYPFVRAELKQHDPAMFELLEKLWGAWNKGKE